MREIIEILNIKFARTKYPPETSFVALVGSGFIEGSTILDDQGYYGTGSSDTGRVKDIELARIWTLREAGNWGGWMIACILKTGPTPEEIAKLPFGQRLAAELDRSKAPKPSAELKKEDLEKWVVAATEGRKLLYSYMVGVLAIGHSEFRAKFLSIDEKNMINEIVDRVRQHFLQSNSVVTPNKKLVNALMKEEGDRF